jgi:aspartate aminotransferase
VRERIAEHIRASYGAPAFAENVCMTVGAAAALSGTLGAIATEGEQIILLAPYFPEYKVFAEHASLNVVEVATTEGDFRPDLAAIEGAITEKTAAIIVNSPNNPSGAVYTESEIRAIARILREKSAEYGKAIYLISDEPYRELVFEGSAPFIPCYYENTVVCYSFSKSLSIPGDRIGYVFVSPEAADSHALMRAIAGTLRALGYVCAPALLQHLIAECLGMTADVSAYEGCRDILANELSALGFSFNRPDGAFYMLLRSPSGDGRELSDTAKAHGVLIVPSEDFGCPGYARIAFCQSEKMIRDSIPAFKKIADE